jgi:hypothetical protein
MFEGKEVQDKVQQSVDKALQFEMHDVQQRSSKDGVATAEQRA